MLPPLPAASRPSKTTITRSPLSFTHSCKRQSSVWSLRSSFSYCLRFILDLLSPISVSFMTPPFDPLLQPVIYTLKSFSSKKGPQPARAACPGTCRSGNTQRSLHEKTATHPIGIRDGSGRVLFRRFGQAGAVRRRCAELIHLVALGVNGQAGLCRVSQDVRFGRCCRSRPCCGCSPIHDTFFGSMDGTSNADRAALTRSNPSTTRLT